MISEAGEVDTFLSCAPCCDFVHHCAILFGRVAEKSGKLYIVHMNLVVRFFVNALIVFGLAWALPGITVDDFWTAMLVALVLGVLNIFVKPLLIILTIPVTIFTLGLFLLVINAAIVLLAAVLVNNFHVTNFWWALLFSVLMAALNSTFLKSSQRRESKEF
jgi:putative membrane protein